MPLNEKESVSYIKVPVRELVEFVLQSGDLKSSYIGSSRTVEAIKAHQKLQKLGGEQYEPEVTISLIETVDDISIEVSGRIDGVIKEDDGSVIIDEIKTTLKPLEEIEGSNIVHWGQAKCYGYMYAVENNLETLKVRLSYYNLESKQTKCFIESFKVEELRNFFIETVREYTKFAAVRYDNIEKRDKSIEALQFPFNSYRIGQREMAVGVFRAIRDGESIFIEAPTGIGKTMASVFPAIKAFSDGNLEKIFYLTAKNTTGALPLKAVDFLRQQGLSIKTVSLCAKEKICFKDEKNCDPSVCEYAKGHYDRIKDALLDILMEDSFDKENVTLYAKKHTVCPFEFSLDLTNWADMIICDYNYVFDPRVYLKRFFSEGKGKYTFLVDEAHNLLDRAREMFSAELSKDSFMSIKRQVKSYNKEIYKAADKINKYFIEERKSLGDESFKADKEIPKDLVPILRKYYNASEKWLVKNLEAPYKKELLDLHFEVNAFLKTIELFDERYVTMFSSEDKNISCKLYCLDPSYLLSQCFERGTSAVLFSATLSPMDFFINVLGGSTESKSLRLKSPFPRENLCIMMETNISTKYKDRKSTLDKLCCAVYSSIKNKTGNYMIFFPSYKYMKDAYELFTENYKEIEVLIQKNQMNEEERQEFLDNFTEGKSNTMLGFAVLGGVFGEGIDLVGEKLSGAVVVGVGLPQLCFDRDIIKNYYDELNEKGFLYSYVYPGMNKVMQAAGRVIRTEKDRGMILLIDERFKEGTYYSLCPDAWKPVIKVSNPKEIKNRLDSFYSIYRE